MYLDFEGLTDKELWVSHEVMRFKSSRRDPNKRRKREGEGGGCHQQKEIVLHKVRERGHPLH